MKTTTGVLLRSLVGEDCRAGGPRGRRDENLTRGELHRIPSGRVLRDMGEKREGEGKKMSRVGFKKKGNPLAYLKGGGRIKLPPTWQGP